MRWVPLALLLFVSLAGPVVYARPAATKPAANREPPALRPGVKAVYRVTERRNVSVGEGGGDPLYLDRVLTWECGVDPIAGFAGDDVFRISCARNGNARWSAEPGTIPESSPRVVDPDTGRLLVPWKTWDDDAPLSTEQDAFPPPYEAGCYYRAPGKGLMKLAWCPADTASLRAALRKGVLLAPVRARPFRKWIDPRERMEGGYYGAYRVIPIGQKAVRAWCKGTILGDCTPGDEHVCYSISHGLVFGSEDEGSCGPPDAVRRELIAIEPLPAGR